jgi:hypothetical protein
MQLLYTLFSALALAASVTASPATTAKRDGRVILDPTVVLPGPDFGSHWHFDHNESVIWDTYTATITPDAINNTLTIYLGYQDQDGRDHLYTGKLL